MKSADQVQDKAAKGPTGRLRLLIEFGPLIVFFATFKSAGIMAATAAFMAAMVLSVAVSWLRTRHVAVMLWVSFALVAVMGGLTLALEDETFVKMKPTLLFLVFATLLAVSTAFNRLILKSMMSTGVPPMPDQVWRRLSYALAAVYLAAAGVNELVWRTQSTDTWVTIKLFVMTPAIVLSTVALALVFFMPYLADT